MKMTALPEEPNRINRLKKRILLAREEQAEDRKQLRNKKDGSYAWRMVIELVVGMLLGFGIGFSLDKWLETAPLMMIVMSLFGFAGGIRTMMITANEFETLEREKHPKE